jgi:hypothetical protein
VVSRRKKMVAYPDYIDIRKIGINRTGLTTEEKFRYSLTIDLKEEIKNVLVVIMMNPSHANEVSSDKTVNRVIDYAYNNYDKLLIFNALPIVDPSNDKFDNIENLNFHCKKNVEALTTELELLVKNDFRIDVLLGTGIPKSSKKIFDRELQNIYKILYNNRKKITIKSVSHTINKLKKKLRNGEYTYHISRKKFQPSVDLIIKEDPMGKYLLKIVDKKSTK